MITKEETSEYSTGTTRTTETKTTYDMSTVQEHKLVMSKTETYFGVWRLLFTVPISAGVWLGLMVIIIIAGSIAEFTFGVDLPFIIDGTDIPFDWCRSGWLLAFVGLAVVLGYQASGMAAESYLMTQEAHQDRDTHPGAVKLKCVKEVNWAEFRDGLRSPGRPFE